ncbi:hypothetical protein HDU87_006199 [Geranomyces variabilis]|uniref:Uncharacterized protein n=1 Tax=Geranomyces variabilis TaxID=109894 RepID=A0AAD5TGC8_9FUNG|nr:hypothetical protein HDU87_006199 [Geranomyces variabilis]
MRNGALPPRKLPPPISTSQAITTTVQLRAEASPLIPPPPPPEPPEPPLSQQQQQLRYLQLQHEQQRQQQLELLQQHQAQHQHLQVPQQAFAMQPRPPDSGAFVTPAAPKSGQGQGQCRLDGLSIPAPNRPPPISTSGAGLRPPPNSGRNSAANSMPTTPTTPQGSKLSADASEFVCFAVHRIWHRISYQSPPTSMPASPIAAIPTATFTGHALSPTISGSGLVSPPGTSAWYPSFVKAVHNLITRASCTLPHILISLLYVTRLRNAIPSTHTGEGSEFRVFVSALILAQKYHTDDRFANKTWANMTGLPLRDINTMEREFLTGVGGRLHVTREDYEKWLRSVQVLGQEHSQIVKRARVEHALGVAAVDQLAANGTAAGGGGSTPGSDYYDSLRRVRTVPEREKEAAAAGLQLPTSFEV